MAVLPSGLTINMSADVDLALTPLFGSDADRWVKLLADGAVRAEVYRIELLKPVERGAPGQRKIDLED